MSKKDEEKPTLNFRYMDRNIKESLSILGSILAFMKNGEKVDTPFIELEKLSDELIYITPKVDKVNLIEILQDRKLIKTTV